MRCPKCNHEITERWSVQWRPRDDADGEWTTKTIPPGSLADAEKFARCWSDTLRSFRYCVLDGDGRTVSEWLAGHRVWPAKICEATPAVAAGGPVGETR